MAPGAGQRLTDQQRRAITARDVSVALSAGAGCGKTFVLTERFLAQLEPSNHEAVAAQEDDANEEDTFDDLPLFAAVKRMAKKERRVTAPARQTRLSELVAITFTERAAREMRDRIRAACHRRLLAAPDREVDHWLDLIRELDSARISTIHSFCGSLLRSHAVEARLDPQFRVLQQAQADTLSNELIDDELRKRLAEQDEAVIELVVEFGLEQLQRMVGTLLTRRQEIDWPQWQNVTPETLTRRWEEFWHEVVVPCVLRDITKSPHTQTVLKLAQDNTPNNPTMLSRCRTLVEQLQVFGRHGNPLDDLAVIIENARVVGGGGKKAWPDEETYVQFKDAATKLRDSARSATEKLSFDVDAMLPAAQAGLRLLDVTRGVAEAYDARKEELSALDFNDLLIRAKRLLASPESTPLRKRLSSQIQLLLVDEFQDTDPLQVELVRSLCGDLLTRGKLFFVGDYKQSIYRFRGAQPEVFRDLRESTPPEGRLPLSLNFRSQPAILDFVNALFCEELGPDYEPLAAFRKQVGPEPAIELIWAPDESPDVKTGQMERLRQREADWIARRLRALLDAGEKIVWDEEAAERGTPNVRPIRPGDVAMLFRALSNVQYYEEALRQYEIDYYLVGGHAFYAQQEIYDLLNLLRSLSSRCDEVSLAGALRSPMFSLEDETLFWLSRHRDGLFAGLFDEPPPELSEAQLRRVEFARDTLSRLRAIKDRVPIAQLIEQAFALTGYDAVVLAEFLGERKLANLRKLIDQARGFDQSGIFSLADFITQLSEFVLRQPDEPLAATHSESTDVVKLMTVHQSKGLEFPVVVVPDVDRRMQGSMASVAFTPRLGPVVKMSGPDGFDLHAVAEKEEDRAEMIRLFYVATTRAADRLILSSGVPEPGSARGPWAELINRRFDPQTGCLRVELPDGFRTPKLRVTCDEPPLDRKPSKGSRRPNLDKLVDKALELADSGAGKDASLLEPIPPDASARRQYSFSRLSGALHPHADDVEAAGLEDPEGLSSSSRLDPLGLGTLVHDVLAEIDFTRPGEVVSITQRMAPRHLPDADGLEEPIDLMRRFLASPRAAEVVASKKVHREIEFLLAWPPDNPPPDARYLQGYIDLLYLNSAGRWVILDYKTNQATAATIDQVASSYEMQMLLYALAVEQILGSPPEDLILCFLRPGLEHHFNWNQAARERVTELVNRSIATIVG